MQKDIDSWTLYPAFELDRIQNGVEENERDFVFRQYTGYLIGKGYRWSELVAVITNWNAKNRPPFPHNELMAMLNDCWGKWADPWILEIDDWQPGSE